MAQINHVRRKTKCFSHDEYSPRTRNMYRCCFEQIFIHGKPQNKYLNSILTITWTSLYTRNLILLKQPVYKTPFLTVTEKILTEIQDINLKYIFCIWNSEFACKIQKTFEIQKFWFWTSIWRNLYLKFSNYHVKLRNFYLKFRN